MTKTMLIDATHDEETRVAIMDGKRLEEFDYESRLRKQIKGNVFLAKVTRVEPSLQAAFVNFGGNRHGFLPFSEIHPDYFRIPVADREALMEEHEALLKKHEEEQESEENAEGDDESEVDQDDAEGDDLDDAEQADDDSDEDEVDGNQAPSDDEEDESRGNSKGDGKGSRNQKGHQRGGRGRSNHRSRRPTKRSGKDWDPEERFRYTLRRRYKIQEVVKRGQIVLVQATKEERGNKGAAFTTYLSIPGRYCVLMPNSPRGGGVSRKIANYKDRDRMRDLLKEMTVPKGMSVILRTAGVERTKTEVNRDLDYLLKLWTTIRDETLKSSAPALIYEEADLIKRSIRDLYTRDIGEIQVAGKDGYNNAKTFMKMMIPSHAKKVIEYTDEESSLFRKYAAEKQIADIGEVQVTLPSGGYLVINPTEALVSVDVNSGRATKERHIEETALKTNLEAADELARQLRLRDLGGLVVIDFIDMENRRNNGKVERRIRDALSGDRARIQCGRISSFGLMELSRQRLNPSFTEATYDTCSHCSGLGRVRSADATSIMVLRAIEDEGQKKRAAQVSVYVSNPVALYMLNNKRKQLIALEERFGFTIVVRVSDEVSVSSFRLDISRSTGEDGEAVVEETASSSGDDNNKRKRSRGGRSRGRRSRGGDDASKSSDKGESSDHKDANAATDQKEDVVSAQDDGADEAPKKRGRSSRSRAKPESQDNEAAADSDVKEDAPKEEAAPKKAAKKPVTRKKKAEPKAEASEEKPAKAKAPAKKAAAKKPAAKKTSKATNDDTPAAAAEHEVVNEKPKEKKKGWWNL